VQGYDIPPEIEIPPAPPEVARPSLAGLDPFRVAEIPPPTVDLFPQPDVENPFLPKGPGETRLTGRIDVRQEDPVVLRAVEPSYPKLAKEAGAEGAVWVEVLVDRTGRVARARIVRSEAGRILEEAALAAARDYLFRPALQQGHPVPAMVVIPFRFTLR
jgi:protein TonB